MGDLTTAAQSGDRMATLIALRNRLAEEIEVASSRDLAGLSRQLTDVLEQIANMPDSTETSPANEIAKRREERRRLASGQ